MSYLRYFRFSLAEGLGLITFLGITFAAMRYPTEVTHACYDSATTLTLLIATAIAISLPPHRNRAFLGFTAGAALYQLLHVYSSDLVGLAVDGIFWQMFPNGPSADSMDYTYFIGVGQNAASILGGLLCAQIARVNGDAGGRWTTR